MGLFRPAVKEQLKARVAICGPTGSGKTWTSLGWATELAGPDGKIAMVDTERRSGSLYAPHFVFDKHDQAPPYDPNELIEIIRSAEGDGYAVLVIDSLTHYWSGEGGTLDVVDNVKSRSQSGSSFDAWRIGTPLQRSMVDAILAANMHVIVTMRSKMEYVMEEYVQGGAKKSRPVKIGMAPEQRAGVEYEFTVVADMDLEHRMAFTKSRCDVLADTVAQPGRERDAARTFAAWLDDGEPLATVEERRAVAKALRTIPEGPDRLRIAGLVVAAYGEANVLKQCDVASALEFVKAEAHALLPQPGEETPEAEAHERLAAESDGRQAEEAAERAGASA